MTATDNKKTNVLPTFEQIQQKFLNDELDPRNLKAGQVVTLNLQGKDYTYKVENDCEFTCKVQGQDNSIRIFTEKNDSDEDCICMDYYRKRVENNTYSTLPIRYPFAVYDIMIQKVA